MRFAFLLLSLEALGCATAADIEGPDDSGRPEGTDNGLDGEVDPGGDSDAETG